MKLIIIVLLSLSLLNSCGKQSISIGKGEPGEEITKCTKLLEDKDFEEAIQCLEMFKARYATSALAQEAELKIGDAYFDRKEYLLAAESYLAFVKLYPTHSKVDYAHYRAGLSYLKESPKAIDRDQEYLISSIDHLRYVVNRYPKSAYFSLASRDLNEAVHRVIKRQFYIGKFYFKTGEYIACIPRFKDIVQNYPDTGLIEKSLFYITLASIHLGRLDEAKNAYSEMLTKYPKSKFTKKAERKLKKAVK